MKSKPIKFYTTAEAAKKLGLNMHWFRVKLQQDVKAKVKKFPGAYKKNGRWEIPEDAIEHYINN